MTTHTPLRPPDGTRLARAETPQPADADASALEQRRDGPIALLTLNRPERRNCLSLALLEVLSAALRDIAADRSVRAVVLAANGSAFSSGHDLAELNSRRSDPDGGRAFFEEVMRICCEVMLQIARLPQPVIAAVQGVATAAGCQLVATCDLAVASTDARFATPGVDIGLFCSTPMVALSRNIARKPALQMLLTGDAISAEEALRLGLVNRVVAPGSERREALALARKIAAKPAHVVTLGKEAFYRQVDMELAQAYDYTARVMVDNLMMRDAQEGISAFLEKRLPDWQDR